MKSWYQVLVHSFVRN